MFSEQHKKKIMGAAPSYIQCYDGNGKILHQIMTPDETIISHYTPKTKEVN